MATNYLQDPLWSHNLQHTVALKAKVTHYLECLKKWIENTSQIDMNYN